MKQNSRRPGHLLHSLLKPSSSLKDSFDLGPPGMLEQTGARIVSARPEVELSNSPAAYSVEKTDERK
jgi:hypothetical protein